MPDTTLTVAIMDAPYEAAASTTAFRIIAAALEKRINVNVFAYEGAVSLSVKEQAPHPNPVKGTTVGHEPHPTTRDLAAALLERGAGEPALAWVKCGLCVSERGATRVIEGAKRGSPAVFLKMALASTSTLVIPTR